MISEDSVEHIWRVWAGLGCCQRGDTLVDELLEGNRFAVQIASPPKRYTVCFRVNNPMTSERDIGRSPRTLTLTWLLKPNLQWSTLQCSWCFPSVLAIETAHQPAMVINPTYLAQRTRSCKPTLHADFSPANACHSDHLARC